jgi:NDP-sugar pyrophosphorylase family protein
MLRFKMEFMPVISDNGKITNIYFWEDLFINNEDIPCPQFNLPVVIMAGGLGTRLKPLTNVFPKPLIPFEEQTIIERIMSRFTQHGVNTFYISVNYKGELIEYYLNQQNLNFHLNYFKEAKPLGTAGSLWLLKGKINSTFFVSNCDIIIDQDYSEILDYHEINKNEITVVAALKNFYIPYGIIDSGENGEYISMTEKPEYTFKINSGFYILEPHLLSEIPENTFFHITELIEKIKRRGGKVGVFPISEKSWKDVGEWDQYLPMLKK